MNLVFYVNIPAIAIGTCFGAVVIIAIIAFFYVKTHRKSTHRTNQRADLIVNNNELTKTTTSQVTPMEAASSQNPTMRQSAVQGAYKLLKIRQVFYWFDNC